MLKVPRPASASVSWVVAGLLAIGAATGCGGSSDSGRDVTATAPPAVSSLPNRDGAGLAESAPDGTRSAGRTALEDGTATTADDVPRLPIDQALGQMIVARFAGTKPTAGILRRIEAGTVGGVVLFADNVAGGRGQTRRLTRSLAAAARRGGRPPLLIAIDQEGGDVRRLPGPPTRAAAEMLSPEDAAAQGRAAGEGLRSLGITVNLAPVADVSVGSGSFLGTRSFGRTPATVAVRACAFAEGLDHAGVGAALKHFPGLGTTPDNTDLRPSTVSASPERLRRDYAAYERCGERDRTMVMISSAIYPRLLGDAPAVMTAATYDRELRRVAGRPVTISDDLETPAITSQSTPARRAIIAGLDLLLYARTEDASEIAYARLLADVRAGRIDADRVRDAGRRIVALKRRLVVSS